MQSRPKKQERSINVNHKFLVIPNLVRAWTFCGAGNVGANGGLNLRLQSHVTLIVVTQLQGQLAAANQLASRVDDRIIMATI